MKILLIEDNPGDARLLQAMLYDSAEFAVTTADRIDRGLACLGEDKFELIILDLSLPDGEGIDSLRQVHYAARNVPIVVLTGRKDEDLALTAVREGAQDYLYKGQINSELLARVIRHACERHKMMAELQSLALTDVLTGLYNRRGFVTIAEEQIKLARRMGQSVAVAFVDLDGMKAINDTCGHEAGDQALIAAAGILKGTFRPSDVVARLGGDEFVVLAIGAQEGSANAVLKRVIGAVALHNLSSQPALSFSIGFTYHNPATSPPVSVDQLITRADQEMYAHKLARRGGSAFQHMLHEPSPILAARQRPN